MSGMCLASANAAHPEIGAGLWWVCRASRLLFDVAGSWLRHGGDSACFCIAPGSGLDAALTPRCATAASRSLGQVES